MYVLIDVYERDINIVRAYDESELDLAKAELRNSLQSILDEYGIVDTNNWGLDDDGMEGWANIYDDNINWAIKRI